MLDIAGVSACACLKQILPGPYNMDYAVHDNVISSSLVKDLP